MPGKTYEFDVFISYSHKDAEWVTDILLPRLEKTGLKVCIDNRDFIAGETTLLNMQESIKKSRRILLVLTPNWVRSRWTKLEAEIAQITPSEQVENRIVPLMWKRCTIPEHLGRLTWVDFADTEHPSNDSWRQLLRSLGLPEEKIRQHERRKPAPSSSPKNPVYKTRRWLVPLVIVVVLVALVVIVSRNIRPVANSSPTSTSTVTVIVPSQSIETETHPTQTVSPASTERPTDMPTLLPSDTPTATPDPRCIDASIWTPSSTDYSALPVVGNSHDLNAWGISTLNNTYSFFLLSRRSRAELYGLSEAVKKDTSVTFHLKVNQLRDGEFWFGISEAADPFENGVYFVALPNGKFHLRVYKNAAQTDEVELAIPSGSSYEVTLRLEGTKLTPVIYVYGTGTWTYPSQSIEFSNRRFYMGIRPLTNGLVDVNLSALATDP